jgi:hypothetical protein
MQRSRLCLEVTVAIALGSALGAGTADARMQCRELTEDGKTYDVIELETEEDLDDLLRSAAQRIINYSQAVANISTGALTNFRNSVKDAPEAETVTPGTVFADTLAAFLVGHGKGAAKSGIGVLLPGGIGLPGVDFLLGYHGKLERELAAMRQRDAELGLIDWIVRLNSQITNTYGKPPTAGEIEVALRQALEREAGPPAAQLSIKHLDFGSRVCDAVLNIDRLQRAIPSVEIVEGRLYEAWINAQHRKGAIDSCVKLVWKFETGDDDKLYFYQVPGTVLGQFGPQIARRMDQLIPPDDDPNYPWHWITDVDAPVCVCLRERPNAAFKGEDCAVYDRAGRMEKRPGSGDDAFRYMQLAWDESEYIVPKE